MTASIRTACPYCGTGCGVLATPDGQGGLSVAGDPDHPANRGRLCSKGAALGETMGGEGRLLHPRVGGIRATWDEALDLVAGRFSRAIAEHGPDSVAFYVSGQMLTEDYYVANKLMKGFIGSANIDTNSRLCMASTVAGHRRAFGTDTVPGIYEDLDEADLVVLVGSNLAWCHPILAQRIEAARARRPGMKLIAIDPRRTATADMADLHLALAPGSDVALFNRLLAEIVETGAVDSAYVAAHLDGFGETLAAARADTVAATGLPEARIAEFLRLWIRTERVVTIFSQGVNQSATGTDKVNAILNCHLATGRIGRPGMGPFSVTGQPNAMGGREVGGLANTLACHMQLEDPAHRQAVQGFWRSPPLPAAPGLKAVEMFDAVEAGRIKALWIICTNPVVSLPEADRIRAALQGCDFVVVSDVSASTDTARLAHVLLPAAGWGEKDGTVTNSDRTISRQRAVLPARGEARPDWAILADVGRRMGFGPAFGFASPAAVFREHAALSGIAGGFGLDFDISALAGLSEAGYATLEPVRWPVTATRTGGRFFGDGRFFTPSGRGRMVPVTSAPPQARTGARYPFRLNTGRIRDQWHTMTRTGLSPRLSQHLAEPFLDIHPADAAALSIAPASIVEVESPSGWALLRARISDRQRLGEVFAPIHWTAEYASAARVDTLVGSVTDPHSGQPESKAAVVRVSPWPARWFGFVVAAAEIAPETGYWCRARAQGGWRAEIAELAPPADPEAWLRALTGAQKAQAMQVTDPAKGLTRIALLDRGRLVAALFAGPEPVALSRAHVAGLLGQPGAGVLAGRPGADRPDPGATLCTCLNVGINSIVTAIETQGLMTVAQIGAALGAGTNCGSCRSEIAALIEATRHRQAAE